jgi:hypothetical protein
MGVSIPKWRDFQSFIGIQGKVSSQVIDMDGVVLGATGFYRQ